MSVAFTKEDSAETAAEVLLPERPIPDGPNLVTPAGFTALEAALQAAQTAYDAANGLEDVNERRRQAAAPWRDLHYFAERLRTAQIMPNPDSPETVMFGARVRFRRDDGREQVFCLVGTDEADPKAGSIAFSAPLARALLGKTIGDFCSFGGGELEILAID